MGTFKRWTMSLMSSFESVIHQIENHEAMVSSAIAEAEASATRAKLQLTRVKKDGSAIRQRAAEFRTKQETWKERARGTAGHDEKKAIECLKRSMYLEKKLAELEVQEREHPRLERELERDVGTVEERLVTLRQQRNLMRTRQSRAEALRMIQQIDSSTVREIDDIIGRWEMHITLMEAGSGVDSPSSSCDDFEIEFLTSEEEVDLKRELEALLKSEQ